MEKLSVKGLALGGGVLWAFYILSSAWAAALTGWPKEFVNAFATLYIGYGPTFLGGIIGGAWAFFDGAVAGIVIAVIYNWVVAPQRKKRR